MPRPTKLTPETQEKICAFIRQGNYTEVACNVCGVGTRTYYDWIERGKKEPDSIYADFIRAVEKAKAEREVKLALTIERHAKTDWRAAAFKLERMHPERWAARQHVRHEHTGSVTQKVEVKLENLSDGELELLERLAEKALPEGHQDGEGEEEAPPVH